VPTLIEQLEYAACFQGPDAKETLYWGARNEIKRLRTALKEIEEGGHWREIPINVLRANP
jgi:hypothetical protein